MDVRNWVKDNEANSYIILGIRRFNVAAPHYMEILKMRNFN
jgi:hypothetical protein